MRTGSHLGAKASIICELKKRGSGVTAGREDEHERAGHRGLVVAALKVKRRGLNELLANSGANKVLDAAALTYVAAAISTLLTLLYFLIRSGILGGRDD